MRQIYLYLSQNKQQVFLLLFVLLLISFVHLFGWDIIATTGFYKNFCNNFNLFTANLIIFLSNLLGNHPHYLPGTVQMWLDDTIVNLIMPVGSYKFYFVGFILLFIVPLKYYKYSLLIIVLSILFIAFRAAIITIFHLIFPHDLILLLWIDQLIYIPMFVILLFVANKNPIFKPFFKKLNYLFKPLIIVSLPTLVLMLLLLTPLSRIILTYVGREFIAELTTTTLKISKILMEWFGYETVVSTKYIFLGKFWLSLEQPCLGIGVATIVVILVATVKSDWKNKVVFLIIFNLLFVLMNSIRLAVLLITIKNSYLTGLKKVELHDDITYFMYFFAFISFLIYYFWFQDLKFKSFIVNNKRIK